jgi:hypothetical protein
MKRHIVCATKQMDNVFGKTMSGSRSLYVDDLTIGTVSITQRYSTIPYSITLPQTQGAASTILVNDGLGNLVWSYPSVSPPITGVLPVLNGGTGVTQSTGTEKVVLFRSPTFADDITVPTIKGGGIDGSLDITTGLNTSAILSIQSANIIGLTAPAIYIGPTRYPSTTGTAGQYLRTGPPASGFATAAWTTIPISETTGTLPTTRGGTGLTTIGTSGQYLASNGTSLYWETGQQLGVMRYKQQNFPYFYITPPAGMQLWYGGTAFVPSTLDFRTLYPVEGAQTGLSLTYGYEENFGRFVNEYDFPVLVEISYSVARYQPTIPVIETGAGAQYDAALAIFTTALNGGTVFYIEKNNNGDALATTSSASGEFCNGSIAIILQPDDFFQLRGSTTSTIVGLFNVESEIFIKLQSIGPTGPVYAPSSPGSGTVTSVNISSADAFFSVGGGPITTNGTLSVGLSGSALPTSAGGTGLATVGTVGKVLQSNGSAIVWSNTTGTGAVTLSTAPTFTTEITTPAIRGAVNLDITATNFSTAVTGNSFNTSVGIYTQLSDNYTFFGSRSYIDIRGGFEGTNDIFMSATRSVFISATSSLVLGGNSFPQVPGTNGYVLTTNGAGTTSWQPAPGAGGGGGTGTVTSVGLTSSAPFITVTGATITTSGFFDLNIGTLGVANGGTGSTAASTGTGGVVLRTSPTFTTSLNTPQVTGSGTSGDLALTSAQNITLTGGTGNAIFFNTALYLRNKIVGDTGSDLIIENPASFIFLNPAYSTRTQGIALHKETATNQTFPSGTVTNDTTILGDNNLFLGTTTSGGKTNLYGPSGCYANGTRLDSKGYAMYVGSGASTITSGAGFNPYQPTTTSYAIGTLLTYTSADGRFSNNTSSTVIITASYSVQQDPSGGVNIAAIEIDGASSAGTFLAASQVTGGDWATGTVTFVLNPSSYYRVILEAPSGPGGIYDASSSTSYSLTTL